MCRGHGGAAARSSTSTAKEPRPRHRKSPPRPRSGCNAIARPSMHTQKDGCAWKRSAARCSAAQRKTRRRASVSGAESCAPTRRSRRHRRPLPLTGTAVQWLQLVSAKSPKVPQPAHRPLRVYAYDPSLGARLKTLAINEATLDVRWEKDLQPGPIGEYIEVIDVDPASQCCYAPVDLNHPHILTRSGLPPSEASPQFHQQMTYSVAMKTIQHFEDALGRVALWAPRAKTADGERQNEYVQRLRIYPHALRAKNAYYSPQRKAILLGYFTASGSNAGTSLPGRVVFTATSHDIVAHETTHALLDGLHRRFRQATNRDALAFHEAFPHL